MRKYYNNFNEDYELGYEKGRRDALRELRESADDIDSIVGKYGFFHDKSDRKSVKIYAIAPYAPYVDITLLKPSEGHSSLMITGDNRVMDKKKFKGYIELINKIEPMMKELEKAGFSNF